MVLTEEIWKSLSAEIINLNNKGEFVIFLLLCGWVVNVLFSINYNIVCLGEMMLFLWSNGAFL